MLARVSSSSCGSAPIRARRASARSPTFRIRLAPLTPETVLARPLVLRRRRRLDARSTGARARHVHGTRRTRRLTATLGRVCGCGRGFRRSRDSLSIVVRFLARRASGSKPTGATGVEPSTSRDRPVRARPSQPAVTRNYGLQQAFPHRANWLSPATTGYHRQGPCSTCVAALLSDQTTEIFGNGGRPELRRIAAGGCRVAGLPSLCCMPVSAIKGHATVARRYASTARTRR